MSFFPTVTRSVAKSETVTEGDSVLLSCRYSVKRYGVSNVCWGRSCGTLWCNGILAQADGSGVISKVSDHYRFAGDVLAGEMDLHIPKVTLRDSGQYCCRVDIDGYFNDKKGCSDLGPVLETGYPQAPSDMLGIPSDTLRYPQDTVGIPSGTLKIHLDALGIPSAPVVTALSVATDAYVTERAPPTGEVQKRRLGKGSQTPVEPPHIIHEIQTRKPVEENIYTLD
ncbi:hypothetical protein Z043_120079 [Scleropages formosus]|uniref:Ig-like domain-containing protein n=1 Tax=Scleropages formosus TaxID=113540 RepID=A0A0P7TLI1_SCLFO|nr:hypothetical protein Z043_120079 [Scleropages formosus]